MPSNGRAITKVLEMPLFDDLPRRMRALGLMFRLKRIADRMAHDARGLYQDLGLDIESNWHAVLLLVDQSPPMGVAEIVCRLGLTHPSVSALIGQIVARGYLRPSKDPADGCRRTFRLTSKARRRWPDLKRVWSAIREAIEEMLRAPNLISSRPFRPSRAR